MIVKSKSKHRAWNKIIIISYAIFYLLISYNHEPWFDEAQAWQIAKCSSYWELLFSVPHYEGHPPLWHLILSIPAKLGVPYEIGLKSVGFIISLALVYTIVYCSPFPPIIRYTLPFHFYIFYQFGIVVRPYSLLLLALVLTAMKYKARHDNPFAYIFSLALLCSVHAYGIMIAFGLSLTYLFEIITNLKKEKKIRYFFRDNRIKALVILLAIALSIVILIVPRSDTLATSVESENSFMTRLLCTLFTIIPDCFIYRSKWFYYDRLLLKNTVISLGSLLLGIILGILFFAAIYFISSRKSFIVFLSAYIPYAVFAAATYMTGHHVGVGLGIVILWLWITLTDDNKFENWHRAKEVLNIQESKLTRYGIILLSGLCIIIPVYWTIYSSLGDVMKEYSYGRSVRDFLNETGLIDTNIYISWDYRVFENEEKVATRFVSVDPTVAAYYEKNIFANAGSDGKLYSQHRVASMEQINKIIEKWKGSDVPDVIIGEYKLDGVYGEKITDKDYSLVCNIGDYIYYKDGFYAENLPIYVRKDLLEKYGLTELDSNTWLPVVGEITEEMKEAYRKGEISIDDIVDMTIGDFGKMTENIK